MLLFTLAENCSVAVFKFVKDDKDEHDRLAVIKCFLNLFHNVLNVPYDTISKLEWTDLVPTEVYDMMNSLESKFQWNIDSKLLSYKCSSSKNTSWQKQCILFSSTRLLSYLTSAHTTIFTLYNRFKRGGKEASQSLLKSYNVTKSWWGEFAEKQFIYYTLKNLEGCACTSQVLNLDMVYFSVFRVLVLSISYSL